MYIKVLLVLALCAVLLRFFYRKTQKKACPSSDDSTFKYVDGKCVFDECLPGYLHVPVVGTDGHIQHTCIEKPKCSDSKSTKYSMKNGKCLFDSCQPGYTHIPVARDGHIEHMCIKH